MFNRKIIDEAITPTLAIPPDLVPGYTLDPERTALAVADGHSMYPVIQDGDRLVLEFGAELKPGIFMFEFDGKMMVKWLDPQNGVVWARPLEKGYLGYLLFPDQLDVLARVVGLVRAL